MGNTISILVRMKTTLWVNTFLFYFRRLRLVGKVIPETAHQNEKLKHVLSVVAVILRLLLELGGKVLYVLAMVYIPIIGLANSALPGRGMDLLVHMVFTLSCLAGPLMESFIFSVTREKITCMCYLRMDGRTYVRAFLILKYLPFFVSFLPALVMAALLCGGTFWQGGALWLLLLGTRLLGEFLQLRYFDRTGKVLSRNMAFAWFVILGGLALAYVPLVLGRIWPAAEILLHPIVVLPVTALGCACFWYIFFGYQNFSQKLHRSIDQSYLLSKALKASASTSVAEVEIKEKDLRQNKIGRFRNLEGYAYFNALFFARHRRQLVRPVFYRLASVAVIFLSSVFLWAADRESAVQLARNLTLILPTTVYLMYYLSVTDKACKAMFYNCDKTMLRHAFYRRPDTILGMFRHRLLRASLYNLTVAGGLCLAAVGYCLLCGVSPLQMELFLFCISVLLLSVFFTVHHLCMYYIFQPFSEDMQIKNPFYNATHLGVFALCFVCLIIKVGGLAFTLAVLAGTTVYIAAALLLVDRLAPARFRVK